MDRLRSRYFLAFDALLLTASPFLVYALRFEGLDWGDSHSTTALIYTALMVPLRLSIFYSFGLYQRLWRYASIGELERIFVAGVTATIPCVLLGAVALPKLGITPVRVPLSVLFTNSLLSIGIIAAPRLFVRWLGWRSMHAKRDHGARRVLIAGAGAAGQLVLRELHHNPELGLIPVGFVDDDPAKQRLRVSDLRVFGPLASIAQVVKREAIDEVIIAMPSAPGPVIRTVVRQALSAGVRTRTMPGLYEILSGEVKVGSLREVRIEDLLRREPITTNLEQVRTLATGKTVLVSGAGGSIGSELARQIARLEPATLVLLGHGENPIFHILNELRAAHPELALVPVIADIRDRRRMFQVLEMHRPFAVFHAAAHKHVPLMEENVVEAVTNNVTGTQNIVDAAMEAGVEHFVLISTDKAVRPTSVMGATKRVAEHVVRGVALCSGQNYVAVRFGNVLGSQGSVVPTFLQQIRSGGPVTVTDPEMRRYFMTIPEAVQLVLQAGAIGRGGELFLLDMGEPVKIVDLATDLIRLSGLEPGVDIKIEFTGPRPGEKLYEELAFDHEQMTCTEHPKVMCVRDTVEPGDAERIRWLIETTMRGADDDQLRALLKEIVPDYAWTPAEEGALAIPTAALQMVPGAAPPERRVGRKVADG